MILMHAYDKKHASHNVSSLEKKYINIADKERNVGVYWNTDWWKGNPRYACGVQLNARASKGTPL